MRAGLTVLALRLCAAGALRQEDPAELLRRLPKEAISLSKGLKTATSAQRDLLKTMGPVAFNSDTMAVRLPTDKQSAVWGTDKAKGLSVTSVMNNEFSLSKFSVGGTDGASAAHSLSGAGYTGYDKKHGHSTGNFVLAASDVKPQSSDFILALPTMDSRSHELDGGFNWGNLHAERVEGHSSPAEVERFFDSVTAGKMEQARAAGEQKEAQEEARKVEQKAEQHVEQKAEQQVEQKAVQHLGPKAEQHVEQKAVSEEPKEKATEAMTSEEAQKKKKEDEEFLFYQVQLMLMKFPQKSATLFAIFRWWCQTHALEPAEEAERLKLLEGSWKIVNDVDFPESAGKIMVIKDSTIHKPMGETLGDVTFRAYKESRFAAIIDLPSPLGNGNITVYRPLKIADNRLEYDDGNIWEHVEEHAPAQLEEHAPAQLGQTSFGDIFSRLGQMAQDFKSADAAQREAVAQEATGAVKKLVQGLKESKGAQPAVDFMRKLGESGVLRGQHA
eukprot:CAMPEP_0171196838 /NCGR_PEP_ID=MMETSP0790-20130122/22108_1 /TAXON_ID=2925 /ORGANISM="Alexandrium catenella, Strain OF101" /LENGTH=499 /DNA_ID=CAMNT_0011662073 /DNA_START=64 /DNA_END=1563 /DNA_ORIENTATION=-